MYGYLAIAGVLLVLGGTLWLTISRLGKAREKSGSVEAERKILQDMAERELAAATKMAAAISAGHADHVERLRDIQRRRSRR